MLNAEDVKRQRERPRRDDAVLRNDAVLFAHAYEFPGQEQQVWEYYRKNPQALASMRAPIYEEKVVDFLLELADVTDKPVSREELFKADEEEASA